MAKGSFLSFGAVMLMAVSSIVLAQKAPPTSLPPSPAPAPAPQPVNLTDLLTVAGPYHTFLKYLVQTSVINTFQNQANNTDHGITIFVPKDSAFASLKKPSLSNLTNDQLKSLLLFHALPKYYSLAEFNNLSKSNPVTTFAGGSYTLNFTYKSGTIHVDSGWSNPEISSSVMATKPVAVYQINQVLLPVAIFGEAPPPVPAPAPAPSKGKPSDAPPSSEAPIGSLPPASPKPNHSPKHLVGFNSILSVIIAISGGLVLLC